MLFFFFTRTYAATIIHNRQDTELDLSALQFPLLTQDQATALDADINEDAVRAAVASLRCLARMVFLWKSIADIWM